VTVLPKQQYVVKVGCSNAIGFSGFSSTATITVPFLPAAQFVGLEYILAGPLPRPTILLLRVSIPVSGTGVDSAFYRHPVQTLAVTLIWFNGTSNNTELQVFEPTVFPFAFPPKARAYVWTNF
jgi:hypothetical protein